jgi:hypothetical protein
MKDRRESSRIYRINLEKLGRVEDHLCRVVGYNLGLAVPCVGSIGLAGKLDNTNLL